MAPKQVRLEDDTAAMVAAKVTEYREKHGVTLSETQAANLLIRIGGAGMASETKKTGRR